MKPPPLYQGVFPIGDSDPQNLPVRNLTTALPFYQEHLGFRLAEYTDSSPRTAQLVRDAITITLAENGGDPEQASVYIDVSNVDAAYAELQVQNLDITEIRTDEHGDHAYRVFFLRAPDGLCYCLGQQVTAVKG